MMEWEHTKRAEIGDTRGTDWGWDTKGWIDDGDTEEGRWNGDTRGMVWGHGKVSLGHKRRRLVRTQQGGDCGT
jgi:hypothetical protein